MNKPQRQFRNIAYLSDVSGTGFWRHIQQMLASNGVSTSLGIYNTYTQTPILDQKYYKGITSVSVQRWISPQQHNIFTHFLKPICDNESAWLIYGIDDAMHCDEIPQYNRGRQAFESPEIQACIKDMLNTADFVVVTTNYLKEYYNRKYGVPLSNILAIPNFLPRWWFGDKYDLTTSMNIRGKFKNKPRIGIVSSLSHYNVDKVRSTADGKSVRLKKDENDRPVEPNVWVDQDGKEVKFEDTTYVNDDVDTILDVIKSTVDDVQWVFFGFCPPTLDEYVKKRKIEVHQGVSILNYPQALKHLCLQAIIAPLNESEFNYCKSPIKYMESCAIGVPLIAKRCNPYTTCMDDNMLYSSNDELKEKILKLKFASNGLYQKVIEYNWKWLNSKHKDGDFLVNNYWLEDNMQIWLDLFRLKQKYLHISFNAFAKQYEAKQQQKNETPIFKNEDGVEILK